MGIEEVYIFCFVVGAIYALIAGVGAGVFGGYTHVGSHRSSPVTDRWE